MVREVLLHHPCHGSFAHLKWSPRPSAPLTELPVRPDLMLETSEEESASEPLSDPSDSEPDSDVSTSDSERSLSESELLISIHCGFG